MHRAVSRSQLPGTSKLHARRAPEDFLDCFAVPSDLSPRAAAEIIAAFPPLVKGLLRLRAILVRPLGLKPKGPPTGNNIGPFPVEYETDNEVIAGFDDRHLDFRVCIHSRAGRIHLATWVHRHGLLGRAYLGAIMPFHVVIARNALARVARAS